MSDRLIDNSNRERSKGWAFAHRKQNARAGDKGKGLKNRGHIMYANTKTHTHPRHSRCATAEQPNRERAAPRALPTESPPGSGATCLTARECELEHVREHSGGGALDARAGATNNERRGWVDGRVDLDQVVGARERAER